MAEELDVSLVERQRCAMNSETLQIIHQAYGVDAMRRAAILKWWKRFRDGETIVKGQNRLFHYPEACGKRSAARFREVGGALQEVHRLPREVFRKTDRHCTSTKFRLVVIM
jgi:hypothetical protein